MAADPSAPDDSTIASVILAVCARRPEKPALQSYVEGRWQPLSYGTLALDVRKLAAGLTHLGIVPGERVGLVGANSAAWGTAFLAIVLAGGVVVPLDRLQKPAEWADQLARAGAKVVIGASLELTALRGLEREIGFAQQFIWFDGQAPSPDLTMAQVSGLADPTTTPFPGRTPLDLAVIIFTSGTTGKSKGVMLSHRNIVWDAKAMLQVVDIGPSDRFLSVLPISHAYECTCGFLAPLLAGAEVYFARSPTPSEIVADLRSSGATFLLAVPLLLEKLVAGIERGLKKQKTLRARLAGRLWRITRSLPRPLRSAAGRMLFADLRRKGGLDSLRFIICGGAPLAPDAGRAIEALGIGFLQGYGLSETSPVATLNPPSGADPASVGRPLPGVEVKIADPDARGTGEILIRGPVVTQGYWSDPNATAAVFADGWFKTGDLGRIGRRGHLYVTGRSKNLIVTAGGKNISPEEIELALLQSPFIAECIVFGARSREGGGEEVEALVHPNHEYLAEWGKAQGASVDLQELLGQELGRMTAHLAPYKRVVRFKIAAEPFGKTTSQKIKRHMYTEGNTAGPP